MALQSSGAISLSNLQTEFADTGDWAQSTGMGGNPISLSEYYRGSINAVFTDFTPTVSGSSGTYWQVIVQGSTMSGSIVSNGSTVTSGLGGYDVQYTTGNTKYTRFTLGQTNTYGSTTVRKYYLKKQINGSVNNSVPTSGAISLSNFYGATRP